MAKGGVGWVGRERTLAFDDVAAAAGFPYCCAALALHETKDRDAATLRTESIYQLA